MSPRSQASLRDHLANLEGHGLVLRVRRQVDPRFEVAAVIKKVAKLGKAVVFENVKGSEHSVVANVVGSRKMIALGLGMQASDFLEKFTERTSKPFKTKLVKAGAVQEVVERPTGISKLPLLTHFEKDAGQYITAGTVIAKDPETGFRNSSFNRMMLKPNSRFGVRMMPPQHLGVIQSKAEAEKRNLEVAVVLGNHPAEMVASSSTLPYGQDHLDYASSVRGEPLEIVKCKTVDIEVPATAELVIEGEIEANVREEEGPFGEFMQYYVKKGKNHVLKVNALTYRRDYIYQGLLCGSSEDLGVLALSREVAIYKALKAGGFDVADVSLMPFLFNGVISIRKRFEGEPKNAIMAAFGAYSWLKYCIVVDGDVDVHDLADVWWALGTRSQPEKGVVEVAEAMGFPRKDKWQIHRGKLGIDATIPMGLATEFERKRIPGEDVIDLSKYSG